MNEALLQFIWKHQYFNSRDLKTAEGEPLLILSPGEANSHQGPDFLDARIRIGERTWAGHIELHVRNSLWNQHAHEEDPNFGNVILHVVWQDDLHEGDRDQISIPGRKIPLLTLEDRVPKLLLGRYSDWMEAQSFIPCERQLGEIDGTEMSAWKKRLLQRRLSRAASVIGEELAGNGQDWSDATWKLMARNFGMPVNTAAFGEIARTLPLRLLSRYQGKLFQLEALLLGQGGLLEGTASIPAPQPMNWGSLLSSAEAGDEGYLDMLKAEFRFLRAKHRLRPIYQPLCLLRSRPGNFPAVRLAQLAALMAEPVNWWSAVRDAETPGQLTCKLDVTASPYWDTHYIPGEVSGRRKKRLGDQMKASLMINTFSPLLFAFGTMRGERQIRQKAMRWLEGLGAERNRIVGNWGQLGVVCRTAADSQALLELKKHYCQPRKCLECDIGSRILGKTPGLSSLDKH